MPAAAGPRTAPWSRGVLLAEPNAQIKHRRERIEYLTHMRRLVRKHARRIHVVNHGGSVRLEYQQRSVCRLRAVDREIVEADSIRQAGKRGLMAAGKAEIEGAHGGLFFKTLGGM